MFNENASFLFWAIWDEHWTQGMESILWTEVVFRNKESPWARGPGSDMTCPVQWFKLSLYHLSSHVAVTLDHSRHHMQGPRPLERRSGKIDGGACKSCSDFVDGRECHCCRQSQHKTFHLKNWKHILILLVLCKKNGVKWKNVNKKLNFWGLYYY